MRKTELYNELKYLEGMKNGIVGGDPKQFTVETSYGANAFMLTFTSHSNPDIYDAVLDHINKLIEESEKKLLELIQKQE